MHKVERDLVEVTAKLNALTQDVLRIATESHDYVPEAPARPALERSQSGRTTYVRIGVWRDDRGVMHVSIPNGGAELRDAHTTLSREQHPRLYDILAAALTAEVA